MLPVSFPDPNPQCYQSHSQIRTFFLLWPGNEAIVVPSFLEFSLGPLSPLLGDGIQVQEDEADESEQDGWDRHQEPEGEGDRPGLLTQTLVITHQSM